MAEREFLAPQSMVQPADAFFWYAEMATPELRPLVGGLFLLDRRPDHGRLRAAIERLTLVMPRLRQRIVDAPLGLGLPIWRDAGRDFDLDYHLREVDLPAPATQDRVLRFAGEVFSAPLDRLRPLWEAQLIGGLDGGRAALFMKLHHALLDGVGSNALFDAMTQPRRNDRLPPLPQRPRRRPADAPPLEQLARRSAAVAGSGLQAALHAAAHPAEVLQQWAGLARGARGLLMDTLAASAMPVLDGHGLGIGRRLDGRTLSLDRMRRIKAALGVTLNDLVLIAVSGAVGRYRARCGLASETVPCMVPVNLRQNHERDELGNRVGGFIVHLPTAEPDPLVRLERIRLQTQRAKQQGHGSAYGFLMQAVALIPPVVFRSVTQRMSGHIQLICSNVPGPPALRYLAGAKIDAVYPFAPMVFGIPLAIALASYGPTYGVGISSDPNVFPDPRRLGRLLEMEIDAIERRVRKSAPPRAAAHLSVNARRAGQTPRRQAVGARG